MKAEEAIEKIRKFGLYHAVKDLPRSTFTVEAFEMATEALEKQIPKKPKGDYHSVPHYRCPVCNKSVKTYEDSYKIPFCCWCGQRLDWIEGAELDDKES